MTTEKVEKVTKKQPSKDIEVIHLDFIEKRKKEHAKIEKVTRKQPKSKGPPEKTLAQIAKEQGVRPFDPSENGKNWPKGADFQEFIDAIHSGRNNGK